MGYTSGAFLVVVCVVVAEGAVLPDRNSLQVSPVSGSGISFPAPDAIHPCWLHPASYRIRSRREANRRNLPPRDPPPYNPFDSNKSRGKRDANRKRETTRKRGKRAAFHKPEYENEATDETVQDVIAGGIRGPDEADKEGGKREANRKRGKREANRKRGKREANKKQEKQSDNVSILHIYIKYMYV